MKPTFELELTNCKVTENTVAVPLEKYHWLLGASLGIIPGKHLSLGEIVRKKLYEFAQRSLSGGTDEEYLGEMLPKISALVEYAELDRIIRPSQNTTPAKENQKQTINGDTF